MAVELVAPNGAKVLASEAHAEKMLALGFRLVDVPKPKAAPRKRTAKTKE